MVVGFWQGLRKVLVIRNQPSAFRSAFKFLILAEYHLQRNKSKVVDTFISALLGLCMSDGKCGVFKGHTVFVDFYNPWCSSSCLFLYERASARVKVNVGCLKNTYLLIFTTPGNSLQISSLTSCQQVNRCNKYCENHIQIHQKGQNDVAKMPSFWQ